MRRGELLHLADSLGVPTKRRAGGKTVARTNEELRINLLERLWGRSLGMVAAASLEELDGRIMRAARTAQGAYGHPLAAAQAHIALGNNARAEANRLWLLPSRPIKRVMAALTEAKAHLNKAAEFQRMHEAAR